MVSFAVALTVSRLSCSYKTEITILVFLGSCSGKKELIRQQTECRKSRRISSSQENKEKMCFLLITSPPPSQLFFFSRKHLSLPSGSDERPEWRGLPDFTCSWLPGQGASKRSGEPWFAHDGFNFRRSPGTPQIRKTAKLWHFSPSSIPHFSTSSIPSIAFSFTVSNFNVHQIYIWNFFKMHCPPAVLDFPVTFCKRVRKSKYYYVLL